MQGNTIDAPPTDARRRPAALWLGLIGIFFLGVGVSLLVLHQAGKSSLMSGFAKVLLNRTLNFDTSTPAVVAKIQKLQRIETVSYSIDTVVEGKRTSTMLPDLLFGDRILLVVHGQVIAGVDLSKLRPEDVHVQGESITVDLPPSELFLTRLDNTKTRVYARTTGMLVQADPNLETETRQQAEDQIYRAAISDGILDAARSNARATVQTMLSAIGFRQITVK